MNDLLQDVVFAWRNALKTPGIAVLIVITLALGIGANTAMFSVAYHVLLAPLPYEDGERLVRLEQNKPAAGRQNVRWSVLTVDDFRNQGSAFTGVASYLQLPITLTGRGDPIKANAGITSWDFLAVLGVQPILGRGFVASDDMVGAEPVILLSNELWLGKFAGDPDVLGTTLATKNIVYKIIGVLPAIPSYPHANDLWIPKISDPFFMFLGESERTDENFSYVVAKLRNNFSLEKASLEANTIANRLAAAFPDVYPEDFSISLLPLKNELVQNSRTTLILLFAFAFLVALIASANVANLTMARLNGRVQELAIREAVGAAPGRISRQLLTENLVFSFVGAMLGVIVAGRYIELLKNFSAGYTPLASEIRIDGFVLLFAVLLAGLTGVLSSSASLFNRRDINLALKAGGDKITASLAGVQQRKILLVIQFALAFFILTTSTLILLSLHRLNTQDTGYDSDEVLALTLSVNLDMEAGEFPKQNMYLGKEIMRRINAMPEVEAAGIYTGAPLLQKASFLTLAPFDVEGVPIDESDQRPRATLTMISEDSLQTLNIPLVEGRAFAQTDDELGSPVAMMNESAARRFFPEGNALGQKIRGPGGDRRWRTVVGITSDVRSTDLDQVQGPVVYYSFWQFSPETINFYVKSSADLDVLARNITSIVHDIDPSQAVDSIKPLNEIKSEWLAPARLRATLIALFGMLALIVTLSGVVGVVSYNISQRIREIGVHMAIGATPANVMNLFITDGLKIYLAGLLLGLLLMLAGASILEPLLYETAAIDAELYLLSALALTLTVFIAICLTARKAGSMSPMNALHSN